MRHQQDLNLRGQSPIDFKSISLTTRTWCHNCLVDLFRLNAPNVIKKVILAVIYQLSEICARNIWFQILLTNEVVNVAVTRSQGHLRAGLEPAALASINSLSVWNEKKLLHVPIGGHPLTPCHLLIEGYPI